MAETSLQDAVKKYATALAQKVETFINDITTIEVRTYTTPHDQAAVLVGDGADVAKIASEGKAMLRAYTQVALDGDTTVCVPLTETGEIDRAVWELHRQMVQEAIGTRATMLKAMGEASAAALSALRKAGE